ncbi:MAG: hypothetical protein U0234_17355 [Sandaracinus sp.]
MRIRARPSIAGDALAALAALVLALAALGCANPYCGASGEPCCGNECAHGLACAAGVCGPCGHELEPCCATGAACGGGLTCTTGLVENHCVRPCDVFTQDCPALLTCIWIILDSEAVCLPEAVSPLPADSRCQNVNDCERGLVCAVHPAVDTRFFCEPPCTSDAQCLASHHCLPISDLPGETRRSCY